MKAKKNRKLPAVSELPVSALPDSATPRQVAARLAQWLATGEVLRPAGTARQDPASLLRLGYAPRFRVTLFGTEFLLTRLRQEDQFRFFVAYVRLPPETSTSRAIFPRIFYKDSSLVWRCASHFVSSDRDQWIGKGALKPVDGDDELFESAEETTNLPFELQPALDVLSRRGGKAQRDHRAIGLILRRGPDGRVEPYADFNRPRERAMAAEQINNGDPVAWFDNPRRPSSLRFAPGYKPDLRRGLLDTSASSSKLYGGAIAKYRFASINRRIQYVFVAGPHHVWILPPQTLTRNLMSYGLRPIDVPCAENLCLPGYEFHYLDGNDEGAPLHSQIPPGFAGPPSEIDPSRADVSPWNERLPIIAAFRKHYPMPEVLRDGPQSVQ